MCITALWSSGLNSVPSASIGLTPTDSKEVENSEKNEKAGKGFFKKKEKKDKKDEKIEELNDKLLRLMAEFDNFRKRTEKEKARKY